MLNAHRPPADEPAVQAVPADEIAQKRYAADGLPDWDFIASVLVRSALAQVQQVEKQRPSVVEDMLSDPQYVRVGSLIRMAEVLDSEWHLTLAHKCAAKPETSDTSATWDWMERVSATATEQGLQTLLIESVRQLETLAESRGITRCDLARAANLLPSRVDKLLNDPASARLATLIRLANALGCEWRVELVPVDATQTPSEPSEPSSQPPSP
jgi:DNA-binding phage protein